VTPAVLVANTGSSSLKLRLVGADGEVARAGDLPTPGDPVDERPIEELVRTAGRLEAVGHRIVHGGAEFRGPTVVDGDTADRLATLGGFAPLHNDPALRVMAVLRRLCPDLPHVACFDTAFHATLPDAAALYALPREWTERYGLRRYGFHGLSHAWASRRAAELLDRPIEDLRLVTCHLGAGASLAAVEGGRSVDTTMGFTPNEGLVMATRSGSVDPGMLMWLQREAGIAVDDLERALEHESGLRGLSGGESDMRALLAREETDERAATAIAVYLHRLRAGIAAMVAALGGVDALVFTGGVGENAPAIRERATEGLGLLGLDTPVLVVEAREELEIARLTRAALSR
jgi:acetate kinase